MHRAEKNDRVQKVLKQRKSRERLSVFQAVPIYSANSQAVLCCQEEGFFLGKSCEHQRGPIGATEHQGEAPKKTTKLEHLPGFTPSACAPTEEADWLTPSENNDSSELSLTDH